MNYTLWEDGEENVHEICEMQTKYTKNSIKYIQRIDYKRNTKESAKKRKTHNIFDTGGMKVLRNS